MKLRRIRTLPTSRIIQVGIIALILVSFNVNFAIANSANSQPIRLQLKWRNQFQFAGYYAAKIKGYYNQEGLDVSIISGGKGISPVDVIMNGGADIGVSDPGILLKADLKPFVVLATIMQSSGYGIISLKEKNISKPSDLAGKTVGVERAQGWGVLKAVLLKEGIDTNQITVVDRKSDSEDILLDNKIDAIVTYISSQPQRIAKLGYKMNIIRPEDYGVDFYGDILFTTKKYAYDDTKRTDAFLQASLKGWKYALAHEDELIDYILTLPDVKTYGTTRQQLKLEAREIRKLILPDLVEIGHSNLGRWQYMLTLFQKLGIAEKNVSLKNFLYDSDDHRLDKWLLPVIYVLVFAALLVIINMFINWQLRIRVRKRTAQLNDEIEQRKIAEQLAKENTERIEHILNSASIGLWEFHPDSGEIKFNDEFKTILGYPKDYDFQEIDFTDKIHPEDLADVAVLVSTDREADSDRKMTQFRILDAEGKYIHVLSSSKAFLGNENLRISGVLISIEEIKQKELLIIEVSEELKRRNDELKKFAYITSHNLRAPVVNISALYEMIDTNTLTEENKAIIEKIEISVKRMESTLTDLIGVVSQQTVDKFTKVNIDIEKAFDSAISSIENQVIESGATFEFDFKEKDMFYPNHYLESIILNLLTNAIKYRSLTRPLHIRIESAKQGNDVVLKFTDNGIGVDLQRNEAKIFDLYQRFHTEIPGKGIGLFIIKSHLDSLNDKILVESQVDVGTTFTIIFHNKCISS